jgi:hypothetical protein
MRKIRIGKPGPLMEKKHLGSRINISNPHLVSDNMIKKETTQTDPDWIWIQSGQWIRIRIQGGKNDPQK